MSDRVILHCDCNNFFASVESVDHPEYKTVPMAVAGDPSQRHGIILAKNEKAKALGIRTAETVWQAQKKCPGLLLVAPHHEKYVQFSRRINEKDRLVYRIENGQLLIAQCQGHYYD